MILEPLYFSNALKRKKSFVYHKKVQDQKYDIFKVYQAFTVMQGPNFRKENQKKKENVLSWYFQTFTNVCSLLKDWKTERIRNQINTISF